MLQKQKVHIKILKSYRIENVLCDSELKANK